MKIIFEVILLHFFSSNNEIIQGVHTFEEPPAWIQRALLPDVSAVLDLADSSVICFFRGFWVELLAPYWKNK